MKNSHRTGVSSFAIRTTCPDTSGSQRTDQKLQKSFHLTNPIKYFYLFFSNILKNSKGAIFRTLQSID